MFSFFRNELENFYLAAMNYNVNVKPGMYAQVYFDLRETCAFHHMPWALDPLKKSEAKRLLVSTCALGKLICLISKLL